MTTSNPEYTELIERLRANAEDYTGELQCEAATALERLSSDREMIREGLDASIRAAELAVFVIRKQGVMPNSSWEGGFKADLATALRARSHLMEKGE